MSCMLEKWKNKQLVTAIKSESAIFKSAIIPV